MPAYRLHVWTTLANPPVPGSLGLIKNRFVPMKYPVFYNM